MTTEIRQLDVYELPLCLPFGRAFFEEMQLPGAFNEDVFLRNWTTYLTSHESAIFALFIDEGLAGGIGGMMTYDVFTGERICQEFFWFIGREHRRGTGAFRLLRQFQRWGRDHGAVRLRMVRLLDKEQAEVLSSSDDALHRLYRSIGGVPLEVAYDIPLG